MIRWNLPVASATSTSSFKGPAVLGVNAAVIDPFGFVVNLTFSGPLGPVAFTRNRDGETVTGEPDSDLHIYISKTSEVYSIQYRMNK